MFFSSPEIDMQIMVYLIIAILAYSLIYAFFVKEKIKAVVVTSVLCNLVLLIFIFAGTELFNSYNIKWVAYFSFFVWPILNIYLIIKLSSKK